MKFSAVFLVYPFAGFASAAVAEESFQQWWYKTAEAVAVFPNATGWEAAVDELIDPSAKITFNAKPLDLKGLKEYWKTIPPIVEQNYEYLTLTMNDAVGLPAASGRGGQGYMTGTEVGLRKGADKTVTARQALFAVFNDERKAIEWHESVNTLV